jgi:hypothetical protein
MPFYRFHIDSDGSKHVVEERLKTIVRDKTGLWESFRVAWKARDRAGPAFIGTVQEGSFKLQRDIRYRNSFLPMIWGSIVPAPTGARINVTMCIHPIVALFMVFILGTVVHGGVIHRFASPVSWGELSMVVILIVGGFVPEAVKAKRLISEAVLGSDSNDTEKQALGDNCR